MVRLNRPRVVRVTLPLESKVGLSTVRPPKLLVDKELVLLNKFKLAPIRVIDRELARTLWSLELLVEPVNAEVDEVKLSTAVTFPPNVLQVNTCALLYRVNDRLYESSLITRTVPRWKLLP